MHYIYYIMIINNTDAYLSFMAKKVHGILKQLMDLIMVFLKERVNGLKTKMVILRYDGGSHI